MKIIFISDYISIHQKALCDAFYAILRQDFLFLATTKIRPGRISMGWKDFTEEVQYAVQHNQYSLGELRTLVDQFDVVIMGSSHARGLVSVLKRKLVFQYSERPLKKGFCELLNIKRLYAICKTIIGQHLNQHLLSVGKFCADDFARMGCYRNRAWKWGYFIEPVCQQYQERHNDIPRILWVGRMLDWKHCELVIEAVRALHESNLKAHFTIIGTGPEHRHIQQLVKDYHLKGQIDFINSMSNIQVREMMKSVDIVLCTSDRYEGWGVVVNEAMSAGCCVIASDAIGGGSYLIQHGDNGFLFKSGDSQSLNTILKQVVTNHQLTERCGRGAVATLNGIWHPCSAANRFVRLCQSLLAGQSIAIQPDGPCSPAM